MSLREDYSSTMKPIFEQEGEKNIEAELSKNLSYIN